MKPFIERIAEDRPMLYDGGFGSQLFERGIELTNSTLANKTDETVANTTHPDVLNLAYTDTSHIARDIVQLHVPAFTCSSWTGRDRKRS